MAEEDEEKTLFFTSKGIYCYQKMLFGLKNAGATYQRLAPTTVKEMQSLNGKLASLSRFLSRGADKQLLPFFKTLKGCLNKKKIVWNEEAEKAFVEMKIRIANLPTLTSPLKEETIYLYLAASRECISVVLVSERERRQTLIYFVSRVLQNAEANYPKLEKLTLALVHTTRKL
ncbi:uncharacterized protein [Rutidosis leptorrhynchoides]|uniref:uncharacterized protein n=1 Tax=Rutidosis leptorrhynchoides TaxID=125765 RepID=UPI003A99F784